MSESLETTVLPEWRQAVRDFLAEGFNEGDVVPHAWLETHFGMDPLGDTPISPDDFKYRQFLWLGNIEAFRTELLENHQIFLSNVVGEGYRLVPPHEQTEFAQDRYERDAKRSFRKAALTLKNVRLDKLTDAQRRENTDAIAKLSMLRGMQKTALE